MGRPRLDVMEPSGHRTVSIDRLPFTIGRRSGNALCLNGADISRDHAEILEEDGRYLLRDRGSRFGTFVNGTPTTTHALDSGDRIRLGRQGDCELVFHLEALETLADRPVSTPSDLRQIAALLDGLRALRSGHVLDEVLALVMDAAIEVTGAERGCLMLADAQGALEFKVGRAQGRVTLTGRTFHTSRKIPEDVFTTGESRVVTDLLDAGTAPAHLGTVALGIRYVLCAPLQVVRYTDRADTARESSRIGVLYLDSRERGTLLSDQTASALEALATEAAGAIESARLYAETAEKGRLEHEMRIAAEIQRALLPEPRYTAPGIEIVGASVPCRAIGGDFFEFLELPQGGFGFALGDVAGKGPAAALLTAKIQGAFVAHAASGCGPAETLSRLNQALVRRAIQSRFATMVYGVVSASGSLVYANAGHNPPMVIGRRGLRRLDRGGLVLGLFEDATYEQDTVPLDPGDTIVVFSDGVSEAMSTSGEEFGEARLLACVEAHLDRAIPDLLDAMLASVRQFTAQAVQSDDITALVLRFNGLDGASSAGA